ncbi:MAG: TolC family protein [Dysgonamonadaceae bacterium]|jgi:outer membrane protein TolC|nr:TolC family protein [Dysgonamonadaceae bacterium]
MKPLEIYRYLTFKVNRALSLWLLLSATMLSAQESSDSLNHYLQIAASNNAAVEAAFHTYKAALQKIPQAGAYEDPKLDIGFFLEPMDIVGGREIARFQLMQMFPWFGTRKAAETEAHHMAKMAFEQFREAKNRLYLQVKTQWFTLCTLQQKLINTQSNKNLLTQLEALAIRKFSSGNNLSGSNLSSATTSNTSSVTSLAAMSGSSAGMNMGKGSNASMQSSSSPSASSAMSSMNSSGNMGQSSSGLSEVLRIQLEIVELESNIQSILSEITAGKARFNALLNRSANEELIIPEKISQTACILDTEAVLRSVSEQNPMLGMLKEEALSYKAKAAMTDKMSYPMFGIGLQYMLIGKTGANAASTEMNSMNAMNGKDMIMPMLSVTIPVFRRKYKSAKKEATFQQQATEAKYADALLNFEAELAQFKHQLDDASRRIELYRKQAALACTACELLVREFASSRSDLSAVIQVQRQQLDYQLKEAEAIAAYNTVVAMIHNMYLNEN